jgi:hypothetical protein
MWLEVTWKVASGVLAATVFATWSSSELSARPQARHADRAGASKAEARTAAKSSTHFVEFLARPSQYFGHSYVQIGTIGANGKARANRTVGFYPAGNYTKDVFGVRGSVTATAPDLRSVSTARYRLAVSRATYVQAVAYVDRLPQTWRRYDLLDRNCNHMVGAIAQGVGLNAPGDHLDTPENYVRALKAQNGGRERASWRAGRAKG